MNDHAVGVLTTITYNVALPVLIFSSIIEYDIAEVLNWGSIAASFLGIAFTALVAFLLSKVLRINNYRAGAFIIASFRSNTAFVGFPILLGMYGQLAMAKSSVVVGFLTAPVLIATVYTLRKFSSEQQGGAKISFFVLLDPLIIASFLGLLVSFLKVKIPEPVSSLMDMLGSMGIPLALISIGASFRFKKLKGQVALLSVSTFLKLIVLPLAIFLLSFYIFRLSAVDRNVIVVSYMMPVAVSSFIFARQYKSDSELMASALIFSTLISIFTITFWLYFLSFI
jgi:predicted permease